MNHCIECKHSQKPPAGFSQFSLQCANRVIESYVDGQKRIEFIYTVRERADLCGIDGKWFEKKDISP